MTNSKITERDIYNAMIDGSIDAETLKAFAEKKLAQLDHRNEKAKERAAIKRAESDELVETVFGFITDEHQTREAITNAMVAAGHEVTVGKVQARLNKLVAAERISKEKGKVAGEDGKAKAATLYFVAE